MTQPIPETWTLSKPAVVSDGGLVTSHHYLASEIGARVLREGGNAVDAAVSAGFAIGCVEPWMSGLGGGGQMLVYRADDASVHCVDFGMRSPAALDPADYPLREAQTPAGDLFGWPGVVDDRNLRGYYSMAVPGYVAGCALALSEFGTIDWTQALSPAIELAATGMTVDWYATLKIAAAAAELTPFDESRRCYLPNGFAPAAEWGGPLPQIKLGELARTLRRLAEAGPDDFYRGEIAQAIVADIQSGHGRLSLADLDRYRPRLLRAEQVRYRGETIHYAPGLTAGPTLAAALSALAAEWSADSGQTASIGPDADAYRNYAKTLFDAYARRLATLGDADEVRDPSSTTHLCVVDAQGNMVALTQTLLSVFGSRVMLPETGILMNNGIMWFDPRPGRANSIAPDKRPLSNMCPAIAVSEAGWRVALGASGGRRIMPAVMQLLSFLIDYGMTLDEAQHTPRIDVSGGAVMTVDTRLDGLIADQLATEFKTQPGTHGVYPALFACPNAAAYNLPPGENSAVAFVPSPWAKAASAD